jgi:hypothetical protein
VYLGIISRVYFDTQDIKKTIKPAVEQRFISLTHDVLSHYNSVDPENKQRIVNAWKHIVILVLETFHNLDDTKVKRIESFLSSLSNMCLRFMMK